jgi:DNA-binding XRE family transcriptional regulator
MNCGKAARPCAFDEAEFQIEESEVIVTGAQVKAARLLLGWSQSKLAAETGVTAATIQV